jgi:hypothetical protein
MIHVALKSEKFQPKIEPFFFSKVLAKVGAKWKV